MGAVLVIDFIFHRVIETFFKTGLKSVLAIDRKVDRWFKK